MAVLNSASPGHNKIHAFLSVEGEEKRYTKAKELDANSLETRRE